jgi:hypothetical protein
MALQGVPARECVISSCCSTGTCQLGVPLLLAGCRTIPAAGLNKSDPPTAKDASSEELIALAPPDPELLAAMETRTRVTCVKSHRAMSGADSPMRVIAACDNGRLSVPGAAVGSSDRVVVVHVSVAFS